MRLPRFAAALALAAAWPLAIGGATAAERIKIGFVTTITGPAGLLGEEIVKAAQLALAHTGGRIGGLPAELIVEDDKVDPETGVQKATKLIERDRVDIVSGVIFGNVANAIAPVVTAKDVFLIATVGSTPQMLGAGCHPNVFGVSWTIDVNYAALGDHLNKAGIDRVFLMVPNYIAGKLVTDGFKRTFKGEIVGEVYTKLNQPDYSVELAQARAVRPKALVVFYPGGMGITFLKQYQSMGLKAQIPVFSSVFLADETTFPALGEIPLGMVTTSNWSPELDNAANRKFVADYLARHGQMPTSMAAMGYDSIMLIDGAVREVGGRIEDKTAFRAALRKASFASVRGPMKFNNNQAPIQNYYLNQVAKGADGKLYNKLLGVVLKDEPDVFHKDCKMTW